MGWEIAGGKKAVKKPVEVKSKGVKEAVKFPKQETLQPIKLEKTIYDYIRESDDDDVDSDEMDEVNNNKVKKSNKKEVTANEKGSTSPKQQQNNKKADKPGQEPINLLASSMAASQKKKTTSSTLAKTPEQEFEITLSKLELSEFEKEQSNLVALFPSNWLLVNQHLAIFLNQKFNQIADFDPNSSHENETVSLLSSADSKLTKFLNSSVAKLSRSDAEKLFEVLFLALFADPNKSFSNYGLKIFIQLVAKHAGKFELTNTHRLNEILNNNRHRYQRCLIAMWALSQIGYVNLLNGIQIWFDCMLPCLNTKGSTLYVATYLNALLNHHKASSKETKLVDVEQYSRLFELANDKSLNTAGKEATQKLRQAFDVLRANLLRDMNRNPESYFELLLVDLKHESSPKQDDTLSILANLLINNSKVLIPKWKKLYSTHIGQSSVLLEYLSKKELKSLKSMKNGGEMLRYFEEHSTSLLSKLHASSAQKDSKNFYAKGKSGKSNETDHLKKFNHLVKQLNSEHFKRTSRLSMVLRTLIILSLLVGGFFYWDANLNKSTYTNSLQVELKKYGLLEPTQKLINSVKNLGLTVWNLAAYYIPIWYQKFNENVTPVVVKAWTVSVEYANLGWQKTAPYRELAIVYINQGVDFIHVNFPYLMKNLISVFQLAINYATTVFNFVVYYVFQGIDFVGIQLLGWKKGDLEKAFVDAIKVSMEYLTQLLQKLNAYLNQKKK